MQFPHQPMTLRDHHGFDLDRQRNSRSATLAEALQGFRREMMSVGFFRKSNNSPTITRSRVWPAFLASPCSQVVHNR